MSAPLPRPAIDLIFFDLDGTLLETAPEICDAVKYTLRQNGLPVVRQDQVDRWIGHGTLELRAWALPCGYNIGQPIEACAPGRLIDDVSALLAA